MLWRIDLGTSHHSGLPEALYDVETVKSDLRMRTFEFWPFSRRESSTYYWCNGCQKVRNVITDDQRQREILLPPVMNTERGTGISLLPCWCLLSWASNLAAQNNVREKCRIGSNIIP